ncbi:MAG: Cof-type HAD-IIB family hydrolase [Treponema sp.]|nr:Cof-type HAD-IIB family hydrolase [Treponema sp.]
MAVFLDIDGTLIMGAEGPFDDDVAAIERARRQGHRIFFNTGRSLAVIPPYLMAAPWVDGIIAGGGSHVLLREGDRLDTIYHVQVDEDALCAIGAFYLAHPKWCIFEGETEVYAIPARGTPEYPMKIEESYHIVEGAGDFHGRYAGAVVTKITIDGAVTREEAALFAGRFNTFWLGGYSEAVISGESKARGMEIALTALGIPPARSVAVGDSANDLEMIRRAGIGIAMGNACDELKRAAAWITAPCGRGGVARALEKWVTGDQDSDR